MAPDPFTLYFKHLVLLFAPAWVVLFAGACLFERLLAKSIREHRAEIDGWHDASSIPAAIRWYYAWHGDFAWDSGLAKLKVYGRILAGRAIPSARVWCALHLAAVAMTFASLAMLALLWGRE